MLVSASVVRQGRQEFFLFLPLLVRTRYGTSTMSTQPLSTQDVVFRKALVALPQALRDKLAEAELDDPGLLRAYPRSTVTLLGIGDHAPPLDLRRRLTKKGGGGSGMAEAGTDLDTAVDTGMLIVCMGRMAHTYRYATCWHYGLIVYPRCRPSRRSFPDPLRPSSFFSSPLCSGG